MKVLVAEDEQEMRRVLVTALRMNSYEVVDVADGQAALEAACEGTYDCLVFDVMMPKMTGVEALGQIRAGGDMTPILLLTAKAEVEDRIDGLDAGADDYLTKPFALGELLARIRSLTRRNEDFSPKNLTIADVTLDVEQQEIRAQNAIRLAPKEAKLLEYLLQNVGKDVSTEQIFERIWKDDQEADIGLVWVYISYLRQKFNAITGKVAIEGDEGGSYRIHERVSA